MRVDGVEQRLTESPFARGAPGEYSAELHADKEEDT